MKFTIPLITTLLSLLPVLVSGQDACRNCKADVDDSDPRIVYSPAASWGHRTTFLTELYYLGTVSNSRTAGAQATFKFTGVGIEYWAIQPTYNVIIQIDGETLNSGPGNQGDSTIIVASRAFNTSGEHTISITATANASTFYSSIGLDRFRIDNGTVTSSTSSAISSTSDTASSSATKSSVSCLRSIQVGMVSAGFLTSLLLICAL